MVWSKGLIDILGFKTFLELTFTIDARPIKFKHNFGKGGEIFIGATWKEIAAALKERKELMQKYWNISDDLYDFLELRLPGSKISPCVSFR